MVVGAVCIQDPFSLSRNGGLEDVSKVQKYRMSEEDYNSRKGTLREWIRDQKAKNPEWQVRTSETQKNSRVAFHMLVIVGR